MNTRAEAITFCNTLSNVYKDSPFRDSNWMLMRHNANKKVFAWIYEREDLIWINVKCDQEWIQFWRNAYNSVKPGYHLNKQHWNSIILDGTVPDCDIKRMIEESYGLTKPKQKKKKS